MGTILDKIDSILRKSINNKYIFGASLCVESGVESNNNIFYEGYAGNIDSNTSYFIASTTKIYITALLLKAQTENLINIDDKISEYLSKDIIENIHIIHGHDYSNLITVKHLMSHTSGIPDYFEEPIYDGISLHKKLLSGSDVSWGFEQIVSDIKNVKPKFSPGQTKKALYSDTNYQLLGKILENIYSDSLNNIMKNLIFKPLGLNNTYLYHDSSDKKPIDIYYKDKQLHIPMAMASFQADGGIVSNSKEMMVFLKAFFNDYFFSKKMLPKLQKWNAIFFPMQYGAGLMRFKLPRIFSPFQETPEFIGHSGLSGAFAFYNTKKDLYFTGTVNQLTKPGAPFKLLMKLYSLF